MSQAIERRIKKMEQVLVSTETHVIFIRFVAPDNLNDVRIELSLVGSDLGWTRLPKESEDEFIARAKADLAPSQSHMPWLS